MEASVFSSFSALQKLQFLLLVATHAVEMLRCAEEIHAQATAQVTVLAAVGGMCADFVGERMRECGSEQKTTAAMADEPPQVWYADRLAAAKFLGSPINGVDVWVLPDNFA